MIIERHIDSVIDHRQKRVEFPHSIILHAGVHRLLCTSITAPLVGASMFSQQKFKNADGFEITQMPPRPARDNT